jgi:hypothetical protein
VLEALGTTEFWAPNILGTKKRRSSRWNNFSLQRRTATADWFELVFLFLFFLFSRATVVTSYFSSNKNSIRFLLSVQNKERKQRQPTKESHPIISYHVLIVLVNCFGYSPLEVVHERLCVY